jgi:glycosyltransferase involved in cell wall biosynthesis
MRSRVCIISFSPVHQDARVLRQIEYLSREYDVTVIGFGPPIDKALGAYWMPVQVRSSKRTQITGVLLMALGRIVPRLYDVWYWSKEHHKAALERALESRASIYHANDWNALPIADAAAGRVGGKVVFDAHEYAPLEYENRLSWRLLYAPLVAYILHRYGKHIAASATVAPAIAKRYRDEFGFDPVVVLNTPKLIPLPPRSLNPTNIRLVHHGGANLDRHLELMIETMAYTDNRYSLHFYLVGGPPGYIDRLHNLGGRVAPGKVQFHEPVPPSELVRCLADYDVGFFLLKPNNYNYRVALPNKLFDFLAAGLAVCIGPSPGMADLVMEYGCGFISPTFVPADVASMLNKLTGEQIRGMQVAAQRAAQHFTADEEMGKVLRIYRQLLVGGADET